MIVLRPRVICDECEAHQDGNIGENVFDFRRRLMQLGWATAVSRSGGGSLGGADVCPPCRRTFRDKGVVL